MAHKWPSFTGDLSDAEVLGTGDLSQMRLEFWLVSRNLSSRSETQTIRERSILAR